nr:unnamed protein product [Digitaria exilis]
MVDLRKELEQVLMLISGRCLLGKEVRDNMFGDFFTLSSDQTKDDVLQYLIDSKYGDGRPTTESEVTSTSKTDKLNH